MNKRIIRWEKFRNPLLSLNSDGDEENSRIMVRATPFGPEGMKFNPDFPEERVYIGHTNFDIDEDIKNTIDNIEGVEILEVYSSYRMRVTIGKAFNNKKVRRKIKEKLCDPPIRFKFDQEKDLNIYKESIRLNSENKPWIMYILPNGDFESHSFDNDNELENAYPEFDRVRNTIGGVILTS